MSSRMLTLLKTGNHIAIVADRNGGTPRATSMAIVKQAKEGFFDSPVPVESSFVTISNVAKIGLESVSIKDDLYLQTFRCEGAGEVLEVDCAFDEIGRRWYVRDDAPK